MDALAYSAFLAIAFLSGSLPFAVWIGRARGVDIRKVGSGNPGATNLGRAVGKKWGFFCFVLDVLKGLVPVLGFLAVCWLRAGTGWAWVEAIADGHWAGGSERLTAALSAQWVGLALAAVMGHVFSPWLGFRGGKGVATGLGAALGLFPFVTWPGLVCGLVWYATAKVTGYVGLSSVVAATLLPILTGFNGWRMGLSAGPLAVFVGLTTLMAVLVIVRHRGNLSRLRAGIEPKAAWTGRC